MNSTISSTILSSRVCVYNHLMTSEEIREKYLAFFKKQKHVEIAASPLVLEADPTTLFTSSGMQQLVPYLMGEIHPKGKRLVDVQPVVRVHGKSDDLEEIGDLRHLSYFEMLGNWSLGDYFKVEQLPWVWEFLTKELDLDPKKLWVSIFEGGEGIDRDTESEKTWLSLGVPKNHIFAYGVEKNWWSRSGTPDQMPEGEIGGPTSEIFYEFPDVSHNSKYGELCHPNCDCGHFIEIGNSVFMQFVKKDEKRLVPLPANNIDFGGGLERLTQAVQDKPDAFTTDIFAEAVRRISEASGYSFGTDMTKDKHVRIVADHLRASVAIASYGIYPSNKLQGYVLRKLIRRALFHFHLLGGSIKGGDFVHLAESFKHLVADDYWVEVEKTLSGEGVKFGEALERGLSYLRNAINHGVTINGKFIFDLYQSYGFPGELALEILKENAIEVTPEITADFKTQFEAHRALSQTTSAGVFKGGLAGSEEIIKRLHTATHLMQAGLRKTLGEQIEQKGQHITAERARFDFSFSRKLTNEEVEVVEEYVNRVVALSLPVTRETLFFDEAKKAGALGFFTEKYGDGVDVYTVESDDQTYSKEICGGPHVANTHEIGIFKIIKQEKAGANIVRVYATVK